MKKIFLISLSVLQLFTLFLSIILFVILKIPFINYLYTYFYEKTNLAYKIGINKDDLAYYTENLLLYLQTDSTLDNTWYSKKDILHMVDVKNIYQISLDILYSFSCIFIIVSLILFIILKSQSIEFSLRYFNKIFLSFSLIILGLLTYIIINFNSFWINFHLLIFSNDLWLLSPSESNLIKMFPEEFFFMLVTIIILSIIFIFSLLIIIKTKYVKSSKL